MALLYSVGAPRTPLSLSIKVFRSAEMAEEGQSCGQGAHIIRKSQEWRLSNPRVV